MTKAIKPGAGWTGWAARSGFYIEEDRVSDIRERAATVLGTWKDGDKYVIRAGGEPFVSVQSAVRKLADAGLLRTGIEARAVAACRGFAEYFIDNSLLNSASLPVRSVGREILAAEKPKPLWRYEEGEVAYYVKRGNDGIAEFPKRFGDNTGAIVRKFVDAMNAAEPK